MRHGTVIIHPFMNAITSLAARVVYAYLYGWTKAGKAYKGTRADIAKAVGVPLRTVARALAELTEAGYVKGRKTWPDGYEYFAVELADIEAGNDPENAESESAKMAQSESAKMALTLPSESAKMAQSESAKMALSTFNMENINMEALTGAHTRTCTGESDGEKYASESEAVLAAFRDSYEELTGVEFYEADFRNITNAATEVAAAIRQIMERKGLPVSPTTMYEQSKVFFAEAYAYADGWIRQQWTLQTVARKFTQIYTAVRKKRKMSYKNGTTTEQVDGLRRNAAENIDAVASLF